jgi:hypothetical protein
MGEIEAIGDVVQDHRHLTHGEINVSAVTHRMPQGSLVGSQVDLARRIRAWPLD